MKLGHRSNYHNGWEALRIYANQTVHYEMTFASGTQFPVHLNWGQCLLSIVS